MLTITVIILIHLKSVPCVLKDLNLIIFLIMKNLINFHHLVNYNLITFGGYMKGTQMETGIL